MSGEQHSSHTATLLVQYVTAGCRQLLHWRQLLTTELAVRRVQC